MCSYSSSHTGVSRAMGKHITEKELDVMLMWQSQGMTPKEIRNRLLRKRATARERAPSLVAVRRALRGQTFKRSKMETHVAHTSHQAVTHRDR